MIIIYLIFHRNMYINNLLILYRLLQERKDQAIYYDAHILDVQRKMHDIRGCRCIFSIQYDHDKSEACTVICCCCFFVLFSELEIYISVSEYRKRFVYGDYVEGRDKEE